ncbi:MAG: LLM class flavin-dependent oxidoreductase [Anaerolineae bacterium]
MTPTFGFNIPTGEPLGVGQEVAEAEVLGYTRAGIWDSPALFREPWVTLASVARDTRQVALGTWVTNPLSRHPVVTASAVASLDDLAPGRVYLGIGSGDTGVSHLGLKAAPLAQLERYIRTVRRLLEDGQAEYEGQTVRLTWAKRSIPIIVAAHGAKSLRLAGRVGDGVIVGLGITPEVVQGSLELLAQGTYEVGRRLSDLDIWFTSFWFVDPRPGVAQQQGAWAATSFVSHFARAGVTGKLVPPEYHTALLEFGSAYDKVTHGAVPEAQKEAYIALADKLGVRDYFQRRFVLAGTPAEVVQQIRLAMQAGAGKFDGAIDAPLPEHRAQIRQWAKLVIPQFQA